MEREDNLYPLEDFPQDIIPNAPVFYLDRFHALYKKWYIAHELLRNNPDEPAFKGASRLVTHALFGVRRYLFNIGLGAESQAIVKMVTRDMEKNLLIRDLK